MERSELRPLQYICRTSAVESILDIGIWCRTRVARSSLAPSQVADTDILKIRARRHLRNGTPLLECVNLYFNARNAMLYRWQDEHDSIAVLDVSLKALDLPGARVSLVNAASGARLADVDVEAGIVALKAGDIYRSSWRHDDPHEQQRRKQLMQAEVLIPRFVPPELVQTVHVAGPAIPTELAAHVEVEPTVLVSPELFFRS